MVGLGSSWRLPWRASRHLGWRRSIIGRQGAAEAAKWRATKQRAEQAATKAKLHELLYLLHLLHHSIGALVAKAARQPALGVIGVNLRALLLVQDRRLPGAQPPGPLDALALHAAVLAGLAAHRLFRGQAAAVGVHAGGR